MQKPQSWKQALSSICCHSHRIPFPGQCCRLSYHHRFPDLQMPKWESVLVTGFGHPENNSMLSVNSWSSKLPLDSLPQEIYYCIYVYVCVCVYQWWGCTYKLICTCSVTSIVSNSATPWTVACQDSLSMGYSWQEYWSGLPCPPPGDRPKLGIKPASPVFPALQAYLYHGATREAHTHMYMNVYEYFGGILCSLVTSFS